MEKEEEIGMVGNVSLQMQMRLRPFVMAAGVSF